MSAAPYSAKKLQRIVVVFKTHFDLGFTALPAEVMRQYTGPMFSAVREVMRATENEPEGLRYSWTLPAWPLKFLLHDPTVPEETRQSARAFVEAGRLNWHAWPFTTHTAFCNLEELVRGLHISRSLSEEFGRWPSGAKQTDVPGHTWALPTLLSRAGVKFLHLGCNSGSSSPHVPRLFWWEGPDGSHVLTYYSHGGYGTSLLPPPDWPLDTWLAVQQTVDNIGPQSPEELRRMRAEIERDAPGVELVFGELGDFYDSLMLGPEQMEGIPSVRQDLADTWIHGIGTMPREVARVRALRPKLLALEVAAALHDLPGTHGVLDFPLARKVAPLIDAAYEQLLLFGEHTWGLDVKSTIKRAFGDAFAPARLTEPYMRLESSWVAKAKYVSNAEDLYDRALSLANLVLRIAPDGDTPDVATLSDNETDNVVENEYYRVEVDPEAGAIVSLVDKRTGREWVDISSAEPFGGVRYDLYSIKDIAEFMRSYGLYFQDWFVHDFGKTGYPEDSVHVTAYARGFSLRKEGNTLVLEGGLLRPLDPAHARYLPAQRVSLSVTPGDSDGPVDLRYKIEGKQATPLAESTVVPFPLNLSKPLFCIGQTGSVIDPGRDIAAGANRSLWCADWLDISDERGGLTVYLDSMPLVSIGNTGIFQYEPERIPEEPLVYAHLSNTQWGTNFPQWLEGNFSWRAGLQAHSGDWQSGGAHERVSGAVRNAALFPDFTRRMNDLLRVDGRGLKLVGVRPRHNGIGLILRYAELQGIGGRIAFNLQAGLGPSHISEVWRCDLMERPVEQITVNGSGEIEFEIAPFAVETLLVVPSAAGQGAER